MVQKLPQPWEDVFSLAISLGVLNPLGNKLVELDRKGELAPPGEQIFRALELCRPEDIKVILIGQDPYPGKGDADGLCFSAPAMTPSLRIVFKGLKLQGFGERTRTRLDDWAAQGVLMINTVLSTCPGKKLAHQHIGWDIFIHHMMQGIAATVKQPFVIMAWGSHAKELADKYFIRNPEVLILRSCHPQYMNYNPTQGDFYIHHMFTRTNEYLVKHGRRPVYWNPQQPAADFGKLYPEFFDSEGHETGTPQKGDTI